MPDEDDDILDIDPRIAVAAVVPITIWVVFPIMATLASCSIVSISSGITHLIKSSDNLKPSWHCEHKLVLVLYSQDLHPETAHVCSVSTGNDVIVFDPNKYVNPTEYSWTSLEIKGALTIKYLESSLILTHPDTGLSVSGLWIFMLNDIEWSIVQ